MTPSTSNDFAIRAEAVSVRYLIRYHKSDVTLRETVVRTFDPRRLIGRSSLPTLHSR